MGTAPGSVVYLHYDADRGALVKGFEENGEPDIIEDEVRQERKLGPISVASCDWRERRKDWNAYRAMLKGGMNGAQFWIVLKWRCTKSGATRCTRTFPNFASPTDAEPLMRSTC